MTVSPVVLPLSLLVNPEIGACVTDAEGTPVVIIEKVEGWVQRADLVFWTLQGLVVEGPSRFGGADPLKSRFEGLEIDGGIA